MTAWFDIGVNLTDPRLSDAHIISDAFAADVRYLAATGTDIESSIEAASLAARYPGQIYSTAGIHPHYAEDASADFIDRLRMLGHKPEVVAIGECGLDFNRNFSPAEDQLRVFEAQLQLAVELQKPVFLHERDAFDQQITLLEKYRRDLVGGVAHCFTGDNEQMQAYLNLDLYIGVTGWMCDEKRGGALREAVSQLPLNRLVLETDAPYLFPKTLKPKSRTNVPANLPHIAQQVARLKNVDVSDVQHAALNNSLSLFGLRTAGSEGAYFD